MPNVKMGTRKTMMSMAERRRRRTTMGWIP